MSEIDCLDHSYIGTLCDVLVYHPIKNHFEYSYKLTPDCICVGGGSGEHSMLVIRGLNACLLEYIYFIDDDYMLPRELDVEPVSYENYWGIDESCYFSLAMKTFVEKNDINYTEKAIAICIGELLRYHGKHLVHPELFEKAKSLKDTHFDIINIHEKEYTCGRYTLNQKIHYGLSFMDEHKIIVTVS